MCDQRHYIYLCFYFTAVLRLILWSGLLTPLSGSSMGRKIKWCLFMCPLFPQLSLEARDIPSHPKLTMYHCHLLFNCLYPGILYESLWQPKHMEINLYVLKMSPYAVSLYSLMLLTLSPHSIFLSIIKYILSMSLILFILVH